MKVLENQLLIVFGASGDLTKRKLIPALFALYRQKLLPSGYAILGTGRTGLSTEQFRVNMQSELVGLFNPEEDLQHEISAFTGLIHYLSFDTGDVQNYSLLKDKMNTLDTSENLGGNCIFYMATPPVLFEGIARGLKMQELSRHESGWRRIIVEKPF